VAGPDGSSAAGGSAFTGESDDRTPTEALSNMKETGTLHVKVSPDAVRTLKESDTAIVDVMIMPPAPAER
jgi:hypothetical protein